MPSISEPYVHINIISIQKKKKHRHKLTEKQSITDGTGTKKESNYHPAPIYTYTSQYIPHFPHDHPHIRKHSGYQHFIASATSHPSIPSRTHGFVFTCSTVNLKNAGAYT